MVSLSLETRHGVWVAQVPIKPKGISKKKRTIGAPEFRHYTDVRGRFTDLLPVKEGKGRVPALEVLITTARVRECISDKDRTKEIHDAIAKGFTTYGMQTFDQSLMQLVKKGLVTYEEALKHVSNADDFALRFRGIGSTSDGTWEDFEGGRLPNAVHVPLSQLEARAKDLAKDLSRPVVAYCETGNRSLQAGAALAKAGFREIYHLSGGIRASVQPGSAPA